MSLKEQLILKAYEERQITARTFFSSIEKWFQFMFLINSVAVGWLATTGFNLSMHSDLYLSFTLAFVNVIGAAVCFKTEKQFRDMKAGFEVFLSKIQNEPGLETIYAITEYPVELFVSAIRWTKVVFIICCVLWIGSATEALIMQRAVN